MRELRKVQAKTLFFLVLFSLPVKGQTYSDPYLAPNEENIEKARFIYSELPQGVLLSVGTERGFQALAIGKNLTGLALTDLASDIQIYNQINLALLRASQGSLSFYQQLRLKGAPESWRQVADFEGDPILREVLMNPLYVQWWDRNVVRNASFQNFHHPSRWIGFRKNPVFTNNYLFHPDLFQRVYSFAKKGMIKIYGGDLGDFAILSKLLTQIQAEFGMELSAIDISNAWQQAHMGIVDAERMLSVLKAKLRPEAVLVYTDQTSVFSFWRHLVSREGIKWGYYALPFRDLPTLSSRSLSKEFPYAYVFDVHTRMKNRNRIVKRRSLLGEGGATGATCSLVFLR